MVKYLLILTLLLTGCSNSSDIDKDLEKTARTNDKISQFCKKLTFDKADRDNDRCLKLKTEAEMEECFDYNNKRLFDHLIECTDLFSSFQVKNEISSL